ncbi:MAG TPA: hypothetical protein PLT66_03920 [Bacillota bacterium]|nr:hypothetical protein [Bacillota bacterium]
MKALTGTVKQLDTILPHNPYYIISTARILQRREYFLWAWFLLYMCFANRWQIFVATVPILIVILVLTYLLARIWEKYGLI